MPAINLALSAYRRTGFRRATTVNCLVEADPTNPSAPEALIARPGLEAFKTVGTAPIRAVWQKQGLFDNAAVIVAQNTAYTLTEAGVVTTLTGTIAGDDILEMDGGLDADYNSVVRFANGSALYKLDSSTSIVSQETFPDSGNAGTTSVCFHKGYWIASEAGTDAMYYQNPGQTTWNALQFASAEYAPDAIVALRSFGELFAALGAATTEMWRATGNSTSPLEPAGGLTFDIGCRVAASAVNCGGSLIWVDQFSSVRMSSGGEPVIISDHGLSEQIANTNAPDIRASFFVARQHPCYVLTLGNQQTWIYDLSSKRWTNATSDGLDYWRANLFCNMGDNADVILAGDALNNQVWRVDPERRTDGDDTFTMEWTAFLPADEAPVPVANLELVCEVGGSPRTGQGSDPLVGMQMSHDNGKTWPSNIRYRSLGATGDYTKRVRWNALGMAKPPFGIAFRFFCADPVIRRVSAVRANVAA